MATLEQQIGANVRALRGDRSMQELGMALERFTGRAWSRQAVWDAERGRRSFTAAELLALAGALKVTLPQLFETAESVTMPSGESIPPASIDALLAGTNRDKERTMRLRRELRGLRRLQQQLRYLDTVLGVQTARLDRALSGAPEPDFAPAVSATDSLLQRANEQASAWADARTGTGPADTTFKEEDK